MMASVVTMMEIVPVIASPLVEKMAPRSGVRRVVPQVGQPAPRAMRPVMIPAFSTPLALLVLSERFLSQRKTMSPMRVLWSRQMAKVGSQSRKGWLMPKLERKASPRILRLFGKPRVPMSSNLAKPP